MNKMDRQAIRTAFDGNSRFVTSPNFKDVIKISQRKSPSTSRARRERLKRAEPLKIYFKPLVNKLKISL